MKYVISVLAKILIFLQKTKHFLMFSNPNLNISSLPHYFLTLCIAYFHWYFRRFSEEVRKF